MAYQTTQGPIEGLEERCAQVQNFLRAVKEAGFSNIQTYGPGLSDFLNARKNSKTYLTIECTLPPREEPSMFKRILHSKKSLEHLHLETLRKNLNAQSKNTPEFNGLSYDRVMRDGYKIQFLPKGESQRIQIMSQKPAKPYHSVEEKSTAPQDLPMFGALNKVLMRYDDNSGTVSTIYHKNWRKDYADNIFRIPAEASRREINHSLAYYFTQRARGHDLKLMIDEAPDDGISTEGLKQQYARMVHDAATLPYAAEKNAANAPAQTPAADDRSIYTEAAAFMHELAKRDPY